MPEQEVHFTEKDREILIRTSVLVGIVIDDVKEIKNKFSGRIESLDIRVKKLENETFFVRGALALIMIVSTLVIYIYFTGQATQDKQIDKNTAQLQQITK